MVEGLIEQGAYSPSDYNGDSGIMPHGAATLHGGRGRRTKRRKGRKSLRRKSRRYRGGNPGVGHKSGGRAAGTPVAFVSEGGTPYVQTPAAATTATTATNQLSKKRGGYKKMTGGYKRRSRRSKSRR